MAQQMLTCAKCGRDRYESRMRKVRAYGHSFAVCSATTTCKVFARKAGGEGR